MPIVTPNPSSNQSSIDTPYADPSSAAPATALVGAILASISLFLSVGALALPAAAFA